MSDTVLDAERAHLRVARTQLARMREQALSLDAASASDAISGEFLSRTLARRVAALADDPRTTLFFGRIDWSETGGRPEQLYIGRRHVSDEAGDPLVLDWRAPVSTSFYRASPAQPMGVTLRRRFGVEHGELTAYEDEDLTSDDAGGPSAILANEIERPRSGPMRDIVSTIQPEQDELVRADVGVNVCIQGAPGTGKTAVGLHRAAWLLYSFRAKLDRSGVLIVGPNSAFLDHISAVLPSLGEARVHHATMETLLAPQGFSLLGDERKKVGWHVRAHDDAQVATLKADARWAEVIHRAVWSYVNEPDAALVVPRGARKWRVPAYEVREIVDELRSREARFEASRAMMAQRLAHAIMLQLEASGDSPDDRVQDSLARSSAVKAYVKALWPSVDAASVLFRLLSDADHLAVCADGILTPDEQALVLWDKAPRSKTSVKWSLADIALLDEVADCIERTRSIGHLIVDEAQDLSPMQLRALSRRVSTGSVTVLGDVAQATTPWAPGSWDATMTHLDKAAFHLEELTQGFRVPASVIEYASRLLPTIAPGLKMPTSVRSNTGVLEFAATTDVGNAAAERASALIAEPGSIGIIATGEDLQNIAKALDAQALSYGWLGEDHGDDEDHQIELVPSHVAKGLEFDRVILAEPAAIMDAEPDVITGLRRLYVVLTRAVSAMYIIHERDIPRELADPLM